VEVVAAGSVLVVLAVGVVVTAGRVAVVAGSLLATTVVAAIVVVGEVAAAPVASPAATTSAAGSAIRRPTRAGILTSSRCPGTGTPEPKSVPGPCGRG